MSDTYAPSSYDHYYCLKPPILLWFAVFFLSRGFVLPLFMALGSFSGVDTRALSFFRGLWTVETLVPSAVALVVLFSFVRRAPGASQAVRAIWARGRMLLAVAAGIDIALSLIVPLRVGEVTDQSLLSLIAAAADLYFLVYILAARRVRDTFAEFPLFGK